jgi:hypothetical protein
MWNKMDFLLKQLRVFTGPRTLFADPSSPFSVRRKTRARTELLTWIFSAYLNLNPAEIRVFLNAFYGFEAPEKSQSTARWGGGIPTCLRNRRFHRASPLQGGVYKLPSNIKKREIDFTTTWCTGVPSVW